MHRNEKPDMSKLQEVQLRSEAETPRINGKSRCGKKISKVEKNIKKKIGW